VKKISQPNNQKISKPALFAIIIMAVVIVIMSLVFVVQIKNYFFDAGKIITDDQALRLQLADFQKQVTILNDQNIELEKKLKAVDILPLMVLDQSAYNNKLPLILYNSGPFADSTSTEKDMLTKKLINPLLDYYNEKETYILGIYIKIPKNVGEPYDIAEIHKNGGYAQYSFGKKGQDNDYWSPSCMSACEFSAKFKAKYPVIVNNQIK
jgi:hypothetical protein